MKNLNQSSRPKVLLSAYACEPGKSSEQGVGWNWAVHLSKFCDVTVFTRTNNQSAIESACLENPDLGRIRWHYHDLGRPWLWLKRKLGCHRLYYARWQEALAAVLRNHTHGNPYDIIHHLTFASYRYSTAISGLSGSTVWGPVGGAEFTPWSLLRWHNPASLIHEIVRNLQTRRIKSLGSAKHYSKVFASTCETQELFAARSISSELLPTIGLDRQQLERFSGKRTSPSTHRLLYVGNLQFLKGIHFAITALSSTPPNTTLSIVGSGPHEVALRELTNRLGLTNRVSFKGRVAHESLPEIYHNHDIFIFPSLHDSGGVALLEAMASSMPSISLACGGPRVIVNNACGIQIKPSSERHIIDSIARAVSLYSEDSHLVVEHGNAARIRVVEQFSWEVKARMMFKIYKELHRDQKSHAFVHEEYP